MMRTPNQDNPLSTGMPAPFRLDVWEHAYYLKYQVAAPVRRRLVERGELGRGRETLRRSEVIQLEGCFAAPR